MNPWQAQIKNIGSDFISLKRALKRFQNERLNQTYADLKLDPQYAAIGDFFFNRLYTPEDFTFRDVSIKRLQHVLEGRIYRPMTAAMLKVVELFIDNWATTTSGYIKSI